MRSVTRMTAASRFRPPMGNSMDMDIQHAPAHGNRSGDDRALRRRGGDAKPQAIAAHERQRAYVLASLLAKPVRSYGSTRPRRIA